MTAEIGKRIAAHRERRKLTVQAVADRCARLGLPLGRVTITKLEGGKRQAITPAELMVLAAALDTAPIDLLYAVGHEENIEVLPGIRMDSDHALRWFTGELNLDVKPGMVTLREPQSGEESDTYLVQYHDALGGRLSALQAEADEALAAAQENPKERSGADYHLRTLGDYRDFIREPLRRIRAQMRERGMILPEVPPGIDEDTEEFYTRTFGELNPSGGEEQPAAEADRTTAADVTYLTVAEVAKTLRVSKETVTGLIQSGDLPAMQIGKSYRVDASVVDGWLADAQATAESGDRTKDSG